MAFPTAVNSQITDAVTQTNVKVLGDAPAMAMGNLYQATAQALALARGAPLALADGGTLQLRADTLCLHGDRADAATFARTLREALDAAGITVAPLP